MIIVNSILFSVFWYVLIAHPSIGIYLASLFVLLAFLQVRDKRALLFVVILGSMTGLAVDYLLMQLGILQFQPKTNFLPLWFCTLWPMFVAYLFLVKNFFNKLTTWLLALVGAIGGSSSYVLGAHLSASLILVNYLNIAPAYIMAGIWLVLLPFLVNIIKLTERVDD